MTGHLIFSCMMERTSYLGLLEIEDPFPKWFGENRIAIGYVEDHILDGGEIHIYDPLNEAVGSIDTGERYLF